MAISMLVRISMREPPISRPGSLQRCLSNLRRLRTAAAIDELPDAFWTLLEDDDGAGESVDPDPVVPTVGAN
jgi:hypothetical protein